MTEAPDSNLKPKIAAISYLNTVPLVWGLLHGPQQNLLDVSFCLPSEAADRLAGGTADVGIVSSIEVPRQDLTCYPEIGIASFGRVRSLLLIAKCPLSEVRVLAADTSSRTTVVLAQILLNLDYGASPILVPTRPDLKTMLDVADAAVIIGDPALRLNPAELEYASYDLGELWTNFSGKPMIYAMWSGKPNRASAETFAILDASYRYGKQNLDSIIISETKRQGLPADLVSTYLRDNIKFELNSTYISGLETYYQHARALSLLI